jgi:hypothetical protein
MQKDESRPDPAGSHFLSIVGGTLVMGHEGGATSTIQWYLSTAGHGLVQDIRLTGINSSLRIASNFEDISHVSWHWKGRSGYRIQPDRQRRYRLAYPCCVSRGLKPTESAFGRCGSSALLSGVEHAFDCPAHKCFTIAGTERVARFIAAFLE